MIGHVYVVEDGPKALRETLSWAQAAAGLIPGVGVGAVLDDHRARLQRLIDECDRKRPVDLADGVHGNRHTPECGCEPPAVEWAVRVSAVGRHPLLLSCPGGEGQARALAESIEGDSSPSSAAVVTRPVGGWAEA